MPNFLRALPAKKKLTVAPRIQPAAPIVQPLPPIRVAPMVGTPAQMPMAAAAGLHKKLPMPAARLPLFNTAMIRGKKLFTR